MLYACIMHVCGYIFRDIYVSTDISHPKVSVSVQSCESLSVIPAESRSVGMPT